MKKININTQATLCIDDIIRTLAENLTSKQKADIALQLSKVFGCYDMTYIEILLNIAAKKYLLRIKKDKELYTRNRKYFNALKIISKNKSVY